MTKEEEEQLTARFSDPAELKKLLERTKRLHVKDGLPHTFVGVAVNMRSLVEMRSACEKLVEVQKTDPKEVWDTLRSAWGCLLDRLTDLAMDGDQNIGMTSIQWSAFVMLALYFEHQGDFEKCGEAAEKIIKSAIEAEIRRKAEKEGGASSTLQ